jgi:AraC-like DNA-binding protein
MELMLSLSQNSVRELSGGFCQAHEIWFSHPRISPMSTYWKRFGVPVRFNQEFDALVFSENMVRKPIATADEKLFKSVNEAITSAYPCEPRKFDIKARDVIRTLLLESQCNRSNVARRINTSVSTLKRELQQRGTSFERLRDDVRRNLALRYLVYTDLSLTELAEKLGFAELAVLSRACQRWFGSSPSALRRELRPVPTGEISFKQA